MVSAVDPLRPDRGDRIRARYALEALARRFTVDILLVGPLPDTGKTTQFEALGGRVFTVPLSKAQVSFGILRGLVANRPWGMLNSPRLRRVAERGLGNRYDLVLAFQLKTAPLAAEAPAQIRILELTDSLGLYRSLLPDNTAPLRHLALMGADIEEARWAKRYDFALVSAERDKAAIQKLAPSANLFVVENGTTPWREPVSPGSKTSLLFVGNLYYPPNRSGIEHFVRHDWPAVFRRTGIQLRVVGEAPRSLLRTLRAPGVVCLGYVSDLRAEYDRALALVNPVSYGTGTRSKILEAWAAGVPVISTTPGAAGLEFEAGKQILLADTTAMWVDEVSKLWQGSKLWRAMSIASFEHARRRYDASRIWDEALAHMLA